MAAAACLGLLFTAFAYFDDTEESTGNTFEVGTWAVDVEGGGDSTAYTFKGLTAGDSGTKTWAVTNTGTVPAYVDLNINVSENGTGDLGDYLMVHLFASGGDDIYGDAPISGIGGGYDLNLPLEAGESKVITLDWYVNAGYSPDENDKVVLSIDFHIQPAP